MTVQLKATLIFNCWLNEYTMEVVFFKVSHGNFAILIYNKSKHNSPFLSFVNNVLKSVVFFICSYFIIRKIYVVNFCWFGRGSDHRLRFGLFILLFDNRGEKTLSTEVVPWAINHNNRRKKYVFLRVKKVSR